jgi:hypothetical protein
MPALHGMRGEANRRELRQFWTSERVYQLVINAETAVQYCEKNASEFFDQTTTAWKSKTGNGQHATASSICPS